MSEPLEALLAQARKTGDFGPLVQAIPFSRFLGMELLREKEGLTGRIRFAPHLVGNALLPALHGGVLGALLESIAVFAVIVETEAVKAPKTISITVQYLRSARTVDTWARAEIVRQGRRVATVRAIAWQEDPERPVAAGHAQLLLPGPEPSG